MCLKIILGWINKLTKTTPYREAVRALAENLHGKRHHEISLNQERPSASQNPLLQLRSFQI